SPENPASQAVMNGVGMIEEGRIRRHLWTGIAWRDSIVHSILSDEWTEREGWATTVQRRALTSPSAKVHTAVGAAPSESRSLRVRSYSFVTPRTGISITLSSPRQPGETSWATSRRTVFDPDGRASVLLPGPSSYPGHLVDA